MNLLVPLEGATSLTDYKFLRDVMKLSELMKSVQVKKTVALYFGNKPGLLGIKAGAGSYHWPSQVYERAASHHTGQGTF
jgi:hypothetical protein